MYQPHPYYEPQVDALQDTPLWRYMSLGELLGLLTHGRLWLSCIAEMEDKQEGLFFDDSTHDRQLLGIAKRLRYECLRVLLERVMMKNLWRCGRAIQIRAV